MGDPVSIQLVSPASGEKVARQSGGVAISNIFPFN